MAINEENVNIGVIEHIAVILCLSVNYKKDDAIRILTTILKSAYSYYIVSFLMGMLQSPKMIDIKARISNREAVAKKKAEPQIEYSYKIMTESQSIQVQEFNQLTNDEIFQNDPKVFEYVEQARDRAIAGSIYLIGVFLQVFPYNIRKV